MENSLYIGVLIFTAHFFKAIFEKTKIPDVLLLILIGLFLGPILNITSPEEFGRVVPLLFSISLALILFEGGSHLNFDDLADSLKHSFGYFLMTFIASFIIGTSVFYLFFLDDYLASLFFGCVIASISPAVVIPIIESMDISKETKSKLILESALADIISIIFALTILKIYESGQEAGIVQLFATKLFFEISVSILLGFIGAIIWSNIIDKVRRFPNNISTSLAFIFVLFGIVEKLHYNGPLAILTFGVLLANPLKISAKLNRNFGTENLKAFNYIEKTFFSEIIFLVKTFFFVLLGLSVQLNINKITFIGLSLTIIIYLVRFIICKYYFQDDFSKQANKIISTMIPKGLAAAVLVEAPLHLKNLPSNVREVFIDIQSLIFIVIFFSILLTTLLIYYYEKDTLT